jgi:hypothetical protein
MKQNLILAAVLTSLAVCAVPVAAQQEAETLFRSNDTVSVQISSPWRDVQRGDKDESWPATLSWTDDDGQHLLNLEVEQRGKSRLESCQIPPIMLRFDKRIKEDNLFNHQKSLKLVTHCKKPKSWEQYYILEMLAYRIYNLMTDYSFRIRPLEVVYLDSERDKSSDPRFAFVIEDDKAVAKRHGLKKLKIKQTSPNRLDPLEASRLALFQMMVGNLDWSPVIGPGDTCCHNAKLIGKDPLNDPVIAIPYDFDATGLVDAPYSIPPDFLGVKSVRDRVYRGYCAHSGTLDQVRAQFQENRAQVFALFADETRLTERSRNKAMKYMESFYEMLDSDARFQEEVVSKCRG